MVQGLHCILMRVNEKLLKILNKNRFSFPFITIVGFLSPRLTTFMGDADAG